MKISDDVLGASRKSLVKKIREDTVGNHDAEILVGGSRLSRRRFFMFA